jgi:hypothetical protein
MELRAEAPAVGYRTRGAVNCKDIIFHRSSLYFGHGSGPRNKDRGWQMFGLPEVFNRKFAPRNFLANCVSNSGGS